jgi:hypothetical protein
MKRVAKAITFRTITSSTSPITIVGPNIVDTFRAQFLGTIPNNIRSILLISQEPACGALGGVEVLKTQLLKAHSVFKTWLLTIHSPNTEIS